MAHENDVVLEQFTPFKFITQCNQIQTNHKRNRFYCESPGQLLACHGQEHATHHWQYRHMYRRTVSRNNWYEGQTREERWRWTMDRNTLVKLQVHADVCDYVPLCTVDAPNLTDNVNCPMHKEKYHSQTAAFAQTQHQMKDKSVCTTKMMNLVAGWEM